MKIILITMISSFFFSIQAAAFMNVESYKSAVIYIDPSLIDDTTKLEQININRKQEALLILTLFAESPNDKAVIKGLLSRTYNLISNSYD